MLGSNDVCACLPVKDMDAATKFYKETLGLEVADGVARGYVLQIWRRGRIRLSVAVRGQ